MVSLQVYQPSASGMSEEIKDTDCGWSGQVFVVMFSTDGGSCERRKETEVIPAKCDDSSTRTTAISYIPVVNWSTHTQTQTHTHIQFYPFACQKEEILPLLRRRTDAKEWEQQHFHIQLCCSEVIYFWRGKKCKELGAHTKVPSHQRLSIISWITCDRWDLWIRICIKRFTTF